MPGVHRGQERNCTGPCQNLDLKVQIRTYSWRCHRRLKTATTTAKALQSPDLLQINWNQRRLVDQDSSGAGSATGLSKPTGFYSDTSRLTCRSQTKCVVCVVNDSRLEKIWGFTSRLTRAPGQGGNCRTRPGLRAKRDCFTSTQTSIRTSESTRTQNWRTMRTVRRVFHSCGRRKKGVGPGGKTRTRRVWEEPKRRGRHEGPVCSSLSHILMVL